MPNNRKSFPECLMALPTQFGPDTDAKRSRDLNAWVQSHNRAVIAWHKEQVGAMNDGLRDNERGILSLLAGMNALAASGVAARDGFGIPNVWAPLLDGASDALNFDLGRLDGGTLSSFLSELSTRVGRDPNTGEMLDDEEEESEGEG